MLFAVILEHGPKWMPSLSLRDQDQWDTHAAFMDELVETGFVVLGGPLGTTAGALLIVNAASDTAIRDRLAADPWIVSRTLTIGLVERWTILLGDTAITSD